MSMKVFRLFPLDFRIFNGQIVRYGHHIRGLSPVVARNLQQRLADENKVDPELAFKVNIGFALPKVSQKALYKSLRSDELEKILEQKARKNELIIDLEKVNIDWMKRDYANHLLRIAEHYGIFQDLFGDAYFLSVLPIEIDYDVPNKDKVARVFQGNVIKPNEAAKPPSVFYDAKPDTLWTLLMTTPDGHLSNPTKEYCHWFVGNIPGNNITQGEEIINYMPPIPPRGVGYYRYTFILYKQSEHINFAKYKKSVPCLRLADRDWSTLEFYRQHQDIITPANLRFFQSDWDISVQTFYHTQLQMLEPVFEYDFPQQHINKPEWFARKKPFNTYLDKYRDPKDINRDFLMRKLKKVHPFKKPEPPLKYPNAHEMPANTLPWLHVEITKERLGIGRVNAIK